MTKKHPLLYNKDKKHIKKILAYLIYSYCYSFFIATLWGSTGKFFEKNCVRRENLKNMQNNSVFDADSEYDVLFENKIRFEYESRELTEGLWPF